MVNFADGLMAESKTKYLKRTSGLRLMIDTKANRF